MKIINIRRLHWFGLPLLFAIPTVQAETAPQNEKPRWW